MTHPRDVVVEVSLFGSSSRMFLIGADGREIEIAEARDMYVSDLISIEEFEHRVARALEPRFVTREDIETVPT